ncbi:MAG: ATP-binding protein [Sciscionella sp.]
MSTDSDATGSRAQPVAAIEDAGERAPAAQSTPQDDTVELRLRASAAHLSAVRALAADLAMHLDMDLDTIADLRLAVDEACSALVPLARVDSQMSCRFTVSGDAIRVVVTVDSAGDAAPNRHSFAWQVLSTLADRAGSTVDPGPAGGYLISIALDKRKLDET